MERKSIELIAPTVLSEDQRQSFFNDGYLFLDRFVEPSPLSQMQAATHTVIQRSAQLSAPNTDFSFGAIHSEASPRPTRLYRAADEDAAFWNYVSGAETLDAVADLVGPSVRYRESYINFKWPDGGVAVDWHQDFAFFPQTNRSTLTTVTYLEDVNSDMGPLLVVPGSHTREVFDHYDKDDRFAGKIRDEDFERARVDEAVELVGPAGSVVIFDGCLIHGSNVNQSANSRSVLVTGYSAGDAFPYTELPPLHADRHAWRILRGERPHFAHCETVKVRVPPVWADDGFKPIFDLQQKRNGAV